MDIKEKAQQAKDAGRRFLSLSGEIRSAALQEMGEALHRRREEIFKANLADRERSAGQGLPAPMMKRLLFGEDQMNQVLQGIKALEQAKDPLGEVLLRRELDKGLILEKTACPLGLIGMIFESRPDALVQMAGLCLRSGNAVLLKGGSEARETNRVLTEIIAQASQKAGAPPGWIQHSQERREVEVMLGLEGVIDLLIPRGSKEFVSQMMKRSSIPVLGHADGICHVYLDKDADPDQAAAVAVDSKMQYPAACNSAETLLVHAEAAAKLLPGVSAALRQAGCALRGCSRAREIVPMDEAGEADWAAEYLDTVLSIKVIDSLEEAVDHIHTYGSGHTETIVSRSSAAVEAFLRQVDAAGVFANCSTRFADGFRYGLGAEVGISTGKIHARGPVGVEGLLSYRWLLRGEGHIAGDYAQGSRQFTHRDL